MTLRRLFAALPSLPLLTSAASVAAAPPPRSMTPAEVDRTFQGNASYWIYDAAYTTSPSDLLGLVIVQRVDADGRCSNASDTSVIVDKILLDDLDVKSSSTPVVREKVLRSGSYLASGGFAGIFEAEASQESRFSVQITDLSYHSLTIDQSALAAMAAFRERQKDLLASDRVCALWVAVTVSHRLYSSREFVETSAQASASIFVDGRAWKSNESMQTVVAFGMQLRELARTAKADVNLRAPRKVGVRSKPTARSVSAKASKR